MRSLTHFMIDRLWTYLLVFLVLFGCSTSKVEEGQASSSAVSIKRPADLYPQLIYDVQTQRIFPDGKTFVDCIPKVEPEEIIETYELVKSREDFDLEIFVRTHFHMPIKLPIVQIENSGWETSDHIAYVWQILERSADTLASGSLIPLKYPYVVPGGRFVEMYYWDSYFTMLGLQTSGEHKLVRSMVMNFADLIDQFGFIPNGNRTYFLGRSQPPFFSLMVELLEQTEGERALSEFLPYLEKEYSFWMNGTDKVSTKNRSHEHVVFVDSGWVMNRYWDHFDGPRDEMVGDDLEVAKKSGRKEQVMFKHLRAGAASGWDYSSRWFEDGLTMETIQTTNYIPVDLNALLYQLERVIERGNRMTGNLDKANRFSERAKQRAELINRYCWDAEAGFYTDYNFVSNEQSNEISLAGVYPLAFGIASEQQAAAVKQMIEKQFLKPGGVVSTLSTSGQQWDAPNGWAPLQWMAIWGLKNYGYDGLANEIAERWLELNDRVFARTGKMMEKYNVEDMSLEAGGGEYDLQDGFGWTNGVYLKLESTLE